MTVGKTYAYFTMFALDKRREYWYKTLSARRGKPSLLPLRAWLKKPKLKSRTYRAGKAETPKRFGVFCYLLGEAGTVSRFGISTGIGAGRGQLSTLIGFGILCTLLFFSPIFIFYILLYFDPFSGIEYL